MYISIYYKYNSYKYIFILYVYYLHYSFNNIMEHKENINILFRKKVIMNYIYIYTYIYYKYVLERIKMN